MYGIAHVGETSDDRLCRGGALELSRRCSHAPAGGPPRRHQHRPSSSRAAAAPATAARHRCCRPHTGVTAGRVHACAAGDPPAAALAMRRRRPHPWPRRRPRPRLLLRRGGACLAFAGAVPLLLFLLGILAPQVGRSRHPVLALLAVPPARRAPCCWRAHGADRAASTLQRTVALLALSSVPFSITTATIEPSSTVSVVRVATGRRFQSRFEGRSSPPPPRTDDSVAPQGDQAREDHPGTVSSQACAQTGNYQHLRPGRRI